MMARIILTLCTAFFVVSAGWSQEAKTDTVRQQRIITLHNGTEIVETQTETVTEEKMPGKKKQKKSKVYKPKNMKYRLALLEVEFEVEKYRKDLRQAESDVKKKGLQELIDKVSLIKDVKSVEYNLDYTQLFITLPDESEYRVNL